MRDTPALNAWLETLPAHWMAECDPRLFVAAMAAYESPGRHYHTWNHVTACVDLLKTFPCDDPRLVFLALVFHDTVYIPGRSDNEERSAGLAREMLTSMSQSTSAEVEAIERMILATRDHHANASKLTPAGRTMLDLDLSILESPPDAYARYAREIHDEYCPAVATESRYRIGRRTFLDRMAKAPHIFLTGEGRRRWDAAARQNLRWESAELAKEQGVFGRLVSSVRRS